MSQCGLQGALHHAQLNQDNTPIRSQTRLYCNLQMGPGGQELEEERDKLAAALERLAGVQRELAEAQRNLMMGQKQLAQQQTHLVGLITQSSNASG